MHIEFASIVLDSVANLLKATSDHCPLVSQQITVLGRRVHHQTPTTVEAEQIGMQRRRGEATKEEKPYEGNGNCGSPSHILCISLP
jgi:hypothetical protein